MGCKQRSFAADWHQRLPVVRGLNLQQAPGLSQINEVDCCTETACKSTGCVKKLDGIKWPVAEDSQIDVAVGSAFTSRPASVEPRPQQFMTGKGSSPFLEHRSSQAISSLHFFIIHADTGSIRECSVATFLHAVPIHDTNSSSATNRPAVRAPLIELVVR